MSLIIQNHKNKHARETTYKITNNDNIEWYFNKRINCSDSCCICLEDCFDFVQLGCGHIICKDCNKHIQYTEIWYQLFTETDTDEVDSVGQGKICFKTCPYCRSIKNINSIWIGMFDERKTLKEWSLDTMHIIDDFLKMFNNFEKMNIVIDNCFKVDQQTGEMPQELFN